jgi:hypothetical protein
LIHCVPQGLYKNESLEGLSVEIVTEIMRFSPLSFEQVFYQ